MKCRPAWSARFWPLLSLAAVMLSMGCRPASDESSTNPSVDRPAGHEAEDESPAVRRSLPMAEAGSSSPSANGLEQTVTSDGPQRASPSASGSGDDGGDASGELPLLPDLPAATGDSPTPPIPNERSVPAGSYLAGQPPQFEEGRLAQAGIRRIEGKHLILYTDLPATEMVDELPRVFDAAVPQWCDYFNVKPQRAADWKIVGCLMRDRDVFVAVGLLPQHVPKFEHGYQLGWQLWWFDKPSDYYRRHLLLHEGTHAFMAHFLGGGGPPWYMEGMAELLSLHEWLGGRLKLNVMPESAEAVPLWGRVKIVREAVRAGRWMSLHDVFGYGPSAHRRVDAYAFSWAACLLLSEHPRYAAAFRQLQTLVRFPTRFQGYVATAFPADDARLQEDWHVFLNELDYGCAVSGVVVHRREAVPLPEEGATIVVDSREGWQSSGYLLEADRGYRITARGRVTVRPGAQPWTSEPQGITIHYHRGRPLGMLLGAARPDPLPLGVLTPLVQPQPIGSSRDLKIASPAVFYFRINEYCGNLADNEGTYEVRIEPN